MMTFTDNYVLDYMKYKYLEDEYQTNLLQLIDRDSFSAQSSLVEQ